MTNQRNVRNLILGKALSVGTGVPAAGTQVEPSNMADGTVVITDLSGKRITTLASGEGTKGFCVVQGQGADKPIIKHVIKPANITGAYLKNYSAATEQVSYIGSNGTTGGLPAGSLDTTYYGAIVLQGEFLTFGAREMKKTFLYKCTTSNTTADVAAGLAENIYNGVAKMADPYYKVERVATTTSVLAFTGTSTAIKLSKGSKTVAFVTATGAASTGTIADGDVISMPSTNGSSFSFSAPSDTSGTCTLIIGSTIYSITMATSATNNGTLLAAAINAGTQATATGTTTVTVTLLPTIKPTTLSVWNGNGAGTPVAIAVTTLVGDSNDGSPLIIISNGQIETDNGIDPIQEDINSDFNSLYFASKHIIPLQVANTKRASYDVVPITANQYLGNQVVINGGRLYFNAKEDSAFISAKESIGLNAKTLNLDAETYFCVDAKSIYLGVKARTAGTKQPVVLGGQLENWMNSLLDALSSVASALSSAAAVSGGPVTQLNAAGPELQAVVRSLRTQIKQFQSNKVFTE